MSVEVFVFTMNRDCKGLQRFAKSVEQSCVIFCFYLAHHMSVNYKSMANSFAGMVGAQQAGNIIQSVTAFASRKKKKGSGV